MDGRWLVNMETSQLADFDVFKYATINYRQKLNSTYKEFKSDYSRLRSINLLFNRMSRGEPLNFRLVLNHIVVLGNVFEIHALSTLLFLSIDRDHWSEIKTILLFLNILPVVLPEIGINTLDIPINENILKELNQI